MTLNKVILLYTIFIFSLFNLYSEDRTLSYSFGTGDWYPIIYSDAESELGYNGLYVEIIEELFVKRLGYNIKFLENPWKRAQQLVEDGEADFLITVATIDRLKYCVKTDFPVYNLFMGVYTYNGHSQIDEINKIKEIPDIKKMELIPVSNFGNGWHKQNIDVYGINTLYVKKDENIVKLLANKRADIMVDTIIPMNYEIKKHGLSNKIELTDVRFGPIEFHILLSKKTISSSSAKEINSAAVDLYNEGFFEKLAAKYSVLE